MKIRSEVMAKLKMFWKEAPFQELHCNEMLGMDDVFGIDIDSILNRAKFVFDTTVCQSLLSTFSNCLPASDSQKSLTDTYSLFQMNSVRVRLIDTGEIIDMERHFSLQKLPDDIKSLPAAAFLCKINQVIISCSLITCRSILIASIQRKSLSYFVDNVIVYIFCQIFFSIPLSIDSWSRSAFTAKFPERSDIWISNSWNRWK